VDKEFDDNISDWTKAALKHFDEIGWFNNKEFSYFEFNSFLDTDNRSISDLSSDELDYLVDCAIEDRLIYELLEEYVFNALEKSEMIPNEILNLSAHVFSGKIAKPRKARSNKKDMEDYTLLLIAEVLAAKFKISTSRNDSTKTPKCAFDYIEYCLRDLKSNKELSVDITTTFYSLSRMRSNKEKVAKRVDQTLKLIGPITPKR
jgi:hypothetical protein